jgi:hypothetical protein
VQLSTSSDPGVVTTPTDSGSSPPEQPPGAPPQEPQLPPQTTPQQQGQTPPPITLSLSGEGTDIPGSAHTVEALAQAGTTPVNGARLVWSVAGVNPAGGTATTGSNGKANISWNGSKAGNDTLTVFADANANGSRDAGEPQQTFAVLWLAPPTQGKTANVEPVSGVVFIKIPGGARAAKRWKLGPAQANGFVRLDEAKNVPLHSTLDTTNGRVQLQTAAGKAGGVTKTQNGEFFQGVFQFTQTKGKAPITQLTLNGQLDCSSKKTEVTGAAKKKKAKSRSLWGSDHGGRFRTRGRHSSATVRGTEWLTKDTCTTTTTVVKSGTVVVHDFAKDKDVKVKKGHKYVARAKKAKKKRR